MPERNTRVAILGTPSVDKDFAVFDAERARTQGDAKDLERDARRVLRELRRERERARRDLRRSR